MTPSELRTLLEEAVYGERLHIEKITIAAAVISEMLALRGMRATLVGGGAIEFHASEIYVTTDLDLIVEGGSRDALDSALAEIGLVRRGRHWVIADLFVEVPGNWMSDPVDLVSVGSLTLRVVKREIVLADRIIGFKQWGTTAYGAQALAMLSAFGNGVDEEMLRSRLRAEGSEDALDGLRGLASDRGIVGDPELRALLRQLTGNG